MSSKVTIATVVYNAATSIKETIESVITQSYRNIEYVIVDGDSIDGTLDIINHYAGLHNFIKIKSEPDAGIYDAMNKAQQMASGDFLIFLGSDDVFYNENVVAKFVQLITEKNSVYYGDVFAKITHELWFGAFTTEKLILQNISHQAILYPKNVYKNVKYNLKYKLFADWEYNLRVWSKYGPFKRMELVVTLYGESGATNNMQDITFLNDRASLVKQYFGNKYLWLLKMQKLKQQLIGKTDLRKVKGYFFSKLK